MYAFVKCHFSLFILNFVQFPFSLYLSNTYFILNIYNSVLLSLYYYPSPLSMYYNTKMAVTVSLPTTVFKPPQRCHCYITPFFFVVSALFQPRHCHCLI